MIAPIGHLPNIQDFWAARPLHLGRIKRVKLAAHHRVDHVGRGDVGGAVGADVLTIAHHGNPVAIPENFGHAVRDVDYPDTPRREAPHDDEQLLRFMFGQRCSRFVQDQDTAIQSQGLGNLDQLLLGNRQPTGGQSWVNVGKRGKNLAGLNDQISRIDQPLWGLRRAGHKDILGHRDVGTKRDFLMNKADPQPLCGGRAVDLHGPAINTDFAAVRLKDAVDDVHQGGFPRPILSRQSMNLTRVQVEMRTPQRFDRAKGFAEVLDLKKGLQGDQGPVDVIGGCPATCRSGAVSWL